MSNRPDAPRLDPSPAFRDAIDRLAAEAREQDRLAQESNKPKTNRHFSLILMGGLTLILAQIGLLVYLLHTQKEVAVPVRAGVERRILPAGSCAAVVNKTYWRVLAYKRDKGSLPAKLEDLLGKYIESMPADPVSGKTLSYSVDGERFTLRCPNGAH